MGRSLMLLEVGIKNFVLIEELRLDFDKGLNVLTGETGAGKSIVFDAVGLLLGDRFQSDQVRQGAERASIDGTFDVPKTSAFKQWWKDRELDPAENLLIRREGYPDGRSKAYLNDQPVTLATLQELGAHLVDVHGQNEHQQILKPSVQLSLLDRFAGLEEKKESIAPLYREWKALLEQRNAKTLSEEERLQKIDIFRFQLTEIEKAALKTGEEEELNERLPELKNAGKLQSSAQTAYGALYQEEGSALERLGQAQRAFEALASLAPSAEPLARDLVDAKDRLEEITRNLKSLTERWEADPEALEACLNRLDLISRLKKKYGSTLEGVLAHADTLRGELARLENADRLREEIETKLQSAEHALKQACAELSTKRKKAAKELGTAVQGELSSLGLKSALFRCRVEPLADPSPNGMDQAVFEWAPNVGEGAALLKDIASGGEMSRVMLALKTVLAQADSVPTLIFDEIDAGIGGLTAQAVGKKLRHLSKHHQILCVSHLPQIASCASAHFQVSKRVSKSRTFAVVERLETDARVEELARLLGSHVTPTSVQHAKELLSQNQ
jgi:DNA repair protein RecN (Recombination protein N)